MSKTNPNSYYDIEFEVEEVLFRNGLVEDMYVGLGKRKTTQPSCLHRKNGGSNKRFSQACTSSTTRQLLKNSQRVHT